MTNKKRELIEILLDNVKPEDWPENLPYAAQDTSTFRVFFYSQEPQIRGGRYFSGSGESYYSFEADEICEHWNKTIVHRDEFMKRWNELNKVVDSEGWIQCDGGEMPVEKGTLIDVKYRRGLVNLHVKAGEQPSGGSIPERSAINFKHDDNPGDIIAYRLHAPQQQKTPQQLALEKFGTDWHDNEGVQPVDSDIIVDFQIQEKFEFELKASHFDWSLKQSVPVEKWRIHSDDKESQISEKEKALESLMQPMPECSEEMPCHFVDIKSPLETQIGGDHYTKLAIQPMQYSMKNGLDPLQHTIIKYVTRFRDKAGIEDLEKAKHCIDMLIEFEKENK